MLRIPPACVGRDLFSPAILLSRIAHKLSIVLTLGGFAHWCSAGNELEFHRAAPGTRLEDLAKAPPTIPTLAPDELTDAGDQYVVPGHGVVRLLRSNSQVAVRFAEGVSTTRGMVSLKSSASLPPHELTGRAEFRKRGSWQFLRGLDRTKSISATALRAAANVTYAYPILVDPQTKLRMAPTDEVLASFEPKMTLPQIKALGAKVGLRLTNYVGAPEMNAYRFRLADPKRADPLRVSRDLASLPSVRWAQPNFIREMRHYFSPSNSLFGDQQTLNNTGQNGAVPHADAHATSAWDLTTGANSIVVAIIDDGVDIDHPGLRIFTNPGETGGGKDTDGVDSDGNGLIDDVHGWDFANGDNNVRPIGTNGHGTGCAGIAAGLFNAQAKTAGMAPGCTLLPVKIADDTGNFSTDQVIGEAITYAAHYADVLSNSWGGGSESPFINAAIDYAVTSGRNGKGCPAFFASGNGAGTWYQGGGRYRLSTTGLSGSYYFSFALVKGPTSAGEDTVRVDNICLLDADGYTHKTTILPDQDFEFFNADTYRWWLFSSAGAPFWSLSSDNALTGTGGFSSAASPSLTNGQIAWLFSPLFSVSGNETLAFAGSISIATDSGLYVAVYQPNAVNNNLDFVGAYGPLSGVPDTDINVTYPANYSNAIAVGASTDCDLRSDYSQYHGKLDFVAPSNGGWNDVATLDPLGNVGWTSSDYKMSFGGTSAATPLAAGIAALMLSRNPSLTATEIRNLMHNTCDKIGYDSYTNGVAEHYGYGRVNAARAVSAALPTMEIPDVSHQEVTPGTTATVTVNLTLSAPTVRNVTVSYMTADGTAVSGANYTAASGMVTIPAGATTAAINLSINGSSLAQPYLSFFVNFSNPVNAVLAKSQAVIRIRARDSDGDGMADYWEVLHGFNPNDPADGAKDRDGDGETNAQEFVAGTDPDNSTDFLHISGLEPIAGGFRIRFNSIAGRVYRVEHADSLQAPAWVTLAEVNGTGSEMQVDDTSASGTRVSQFYRLIVE